MKKLYLVIVLAASFAFAAPESTFAFRELTADTLELSENGKPVFVYNRGQNFNFLHPVYANDGTVLTADAATSQQRGIWWMWPVISVGGQEFEGASDGIRQKFERWTAQEVKPRFAVLGVESGWYVGERKLIKETVDIRVEAARNGTRRIDFTLKFEAAGSAVEISGTPDQNIGSGGFSFRFAPRDGGERATVIRTEQGVEQNDGVQILREWGQIEGVFGGHPAGARIEDEHINPGHPNAWVMRHSPGLLNVAYPGLRPAVIQPGRPLILKYRVLLFNGKAPE